MRDICQVLAQKAQSFTAYLYNHLHFYNFVILNYIHKSITRHVLTLRLQVKVENIILQSRSQANNLSSDLKIDKLCLKNIRFILFG